MERDIENERELRYRDWTVLRFWGKDIINHLDDCVRVVDEAVFIQKTKTNAESRLYGEEI